MRSLIGLLMCVGLSLVMLPLAGQTQMREIVNELTVTLTASGHVKAHGFQKRF